MAGETSNGAAEATETTALLKKDTPIPVEAPVGEANVDLTSNGNAGDGDVEAGNVEGDGEPQENPLFEGQPETRQQLHLLMPALALGVSFLSWELAAKIARGDRTNTGWGNLRYC